MRGRILPLFVALGAVVLAMLAGVAIEHTIRSAAWALLVSVACGAVLGTVGIAIHQHLHPPDRPAYGRTTLPHPPSPRRGSGASYTAPSSHNDAEPAPSRAGAGSLFGDHGPHEEHK